MEKMPFLDLYIKARIRGHGSVLHTPPLACILLRKVLIAKGLLLPGLAFPLERANLQPRDVQPSQLVPRSNRWFQ